MCPSPLSRPQSARAQEWRSRLSIFVGGLLAFETLSGLSIWLLPFSVPNQLLVLLHTVAGLLFLVPFLVYQTRHWLRYRRRSWSHYLVTGYVAFAAVLLNLASGLVLTWQGALATRISYGWDQVHIVTTLAIVAFTLPHVVLIWVRDRHARSAESMAVLGAERRWTLGVLGVTVLGFVMLAGWSALYRPVRWVNEFPADYAWEEGTSPFRPSLATTVTGGAFDDRSLTGSASCGTAGCHQEIYEEWSVSAHRWSSMDPAFQAIQEVMAKQNGPESTRYCGGCHDPASLFAGTKNVFTESLTSVRGYHEGVSCLVCHAIRETDLKGNANYSVAQPERYAYELDEGAGAKFLSDYLIRTYPKKHLEVFSKRLFKTPEYCAACHKQFIDEEVNKVGWVQLQNQYDNWRKSKWNPEDDPERVVECRECHMPLVDSDDPASGDELDPYRTADDKRHRDHRFIAANSFIPQVLKLEGWEAQHAATEAWLRGEREIPEIAYKWAAGPAVSLAIDCPDSVRAGEPIDVRVVITSNKVGHDFPTGPLDIIQSWINLEVTDDDGQVVFVSGDVDEGHFISPGAFMFKAEPVDRYGNLIDRHNLWEMVGVRFRRAIFPGFSDAATYTLTCPSEAFEADPATWTDGGVAREFEVRPTAEGRTLHVVANLDYRKADQFLINFMFGEDAGLSAPVVRMASEEKTIRVI
ncbi:MAG: multiheme c-type cytochrome [bacterium]